MGICHCEVIFWNKSTVKSRLVMTTLTGSKQKEIPVLRHYSKKNFLLEIISSFSIRVIFRFNFAFAWENWLHILPK